MGKRPASTDTKLIKALRMVAPGTDVRQAIDNIVRARTGGLLVFAEKDEIRPMISGGIALDIELSPMLLYELAKMDGAILLNESGTRIIYANVQLVPDASIESQETGTRHRTAERVAKQIGAVVISISAARDVVSIYIGDTRYIMEHIHVILDSANQALHTLEKFKERLNHVSSLLSALEFEGAVTLHDVLSVVQRAEMVMVIAQEIELNIIELGTEGRLTRLQLEMMMHHVRDDREAVLADYLPDLTPDRLKRAREALGALRSEDLASLELLGQLLGYRSSSDALDTHLRPRGYRMLRKIPRLSPPIIQSLIERYGYLEEILDATVEELAACRGMTMARAHDLKEGLNRLRELNLLERYG
ncbi:MAG: DNA integrity scanning diadenylate cyclase DisA [Thermoleophilia bacterium]